MRSMINFMQSNQNIMNEEFSIIDNSVWDKFYLQFSSRKPTDVIIKYIQEISINYNIDKKNIIKDFLNYIIRNKPEIINHVFLDFIENITHFPECKNQYYISYFLTQLSNFIPKELL